MAAGEDYYYTSDSDDDDVDRYVFLARQPAPVEEDASSDDNDDETDDEGRGDGRRGKKRPLREVASDASPSPNKKARVRVLLASPSKPSTPTISSPRGVRDSESSGSEESGKEVQRPDPRKGKGKNKTTTTTTSVCGKRGRSGPGCEEVDQEPRRDVTAAAKTNPSSAATSAGRFRCNLCERCFDSHQALGGHVLGHQKKARIAAIAAAASLGDAGGRGNCKAETAVVELEQQDVNNVRHAEQKASAAAPDARGNGSCHEKKPFDDDVAACHEDIDRGGHRKAKKQKMKKKSSVVAEDHMGAHGDCSFDRSASVFTSNLNGVNDDHNREKASSRGFYNSSESEETAIGAGRSHNNGAVKKKEAAALGAPRKGAANGNSNGDACTAQHKCKVCGTECPTGRALGGHMRKHRKHPALGVGGDARPATTDGDRDRDSRIPISRQFGAIGLHTDLEGEASS